MNVSAPHYLLFSESRREGSEHRFGVPGRRDAGHWRFVLESVDGSARLEADDAEPDVDEHRLELLAVVRGLEALNEPARVTLVTRSRYVTRGFRYRLDQWRENNWCWERFGEMTPVRNRDLWRRIDRAMQYHHVECRVWRFDSPQSHSHSTRVPAPAFASKRSAAARRPVHSPRPAARPIRRSTDALQRCLGVLNRIVKPVGIGLGMQYLI